MSRDLTTPGPLPIPIINSGYVAFGHPGSLPHHPSAPSASQQKPSRFDLRLAEASEGAVFPSDGWRRVFATTLNSHVGQIEGLATRLNVVRIAARWVIAGMACPQIAKRSISQFIRNSMSVMAFTHKRYLAIANVIGSTLPYPARVWVSGRGLAQKRAPQRAESLPFVRFETCAAVRAGREGPFLCHTQ